MPEKYSTSPGRQVPTNFEEFWPYYVSVHARPVTRWLHLTGTLLGATTAIFGMCVGRWWMLFVGIAIGYTFAWTAHFVFERNLPATFQHPKWSFRADWRMIRLLLTGKMDAEVKRVMAEKSFRNSL